MHAAANPPLPAALPVGSAPPAAAEVAAPSAA